MDVAFRRTGARRYAVEARPERHPKLIMDPAPGFEPYLPHDLVHLVVEEALGLRNGIFGQLADGGDAGTFGMPTDGSKARALSRARREVKRRGERLLREGQGDTDFSERAAVVCLHRWMERSERAELRAEARSNPRYAERVLARCSEEEVAELERVMDRVCTRLTELSRSWSVLSVGEELVVRWSQP